MVGRYAASAPRSALKDAKTYRQKPHSSSVLGCHTQEAGMRHMLSKTTAPWLAAPFVCRGLYALSYGTSVEVPCFASSPAVTDFDLGVATMTCRTKV